MNISSLSPLGSASGTSPLDAFRQGAAQADQVVVQLDGQNFTVLGQGQTTSGRSVAWVQGDTDTTRMFLDAMTQSFGGAVSQAIARELGLEPAPGKPLASRLIEQALDMAQTSQRALGGVDFLTLMDHSAQMGSASFRSSCTELGLVPQQVGAEQRHQIDQLVRQHADAAVSQGQSPLSGTQVQAWLQDAIRQVCQPPA